MPKPLKELLSAVPLFSGANPDKLLEALEKCEVKEFEAGEYVCHEGEYDENCYVILSGCVEVLTGTAKGAARVNRILLREGEMFGEIAVLTGNPRIADIIAVEPAILYKISKDALFNLIDEFPQIKMRLDDLYRERALNTHLRNIPIFSGISSNLLSELKDKIELATYRKDEVIFHQGDLSDSFYLVRYGFVKVYLEEKGKERVLAYLKEGHYFGEMGLLKEGEKRTASVSAINRAELIKISKNQFTELLAAHPSIKRALATVIEHREERTKQFSKDVRLSATLSSTIETGVIQAKALLIMDLSKCVHCDTCVKACAALHDGQTRLSRRGTMLNNFLLVPTSCRQCTDPTCMTQCPTGAITRDLDGEIYHRDYCIGCGSCARNCPYGNISVVTLQQKKSAKGLVAKISSLFDRGEKRPETPADKAVAPKPVFAGDRDMVARPESKKLAGDRNIVRPKTPEAAIPTKVKKAAKVQKRAVKCDMCRNYAYMGCVYNCPRNAARRVDPTEFFADFSSIG